MRNLVGPLCLESCLCLVESQPHWEGILSTPWEEGLAEGPEICMPSIPSWAVVPPGNVLLKESAGYGLVLPLGTRPQGRPDSCCCPGCRRWHSQTCLVSGQSSVLHGNMVTFLLVCTVLSVCGFKAESEAWRWGMSKAALFVVQYGPLSAGDIPV